MKIIYIALGLFTFGTCIYFLIQFHKLDYELTFKKNDIVRHSKVKCPTGIIEFLLKEKFLLKAPNYYNCRWKLPKRFIAENQELFKSKNIDPINSEIYTFNYSDKFDLNKDMYSGAMFGTIYIMRINNYFFESKDNSFSIIEKYLLRDIRKRREEEAEQLRQMLERHKDKLNITIKK